MENCKGFTLIELMVTLVLLGGGVGALTYLQTRLDQFTHFSTTQHTALALASDKIDIWRAMAYDSIPVESGQLDEPISSNVTFTRTWNIAEFTNPTYKVIDVTVSWSDAGGDSHSIKLATAVAKTSLANAST